MSERNSSPLRAALVAAAEALADHFEAATEVPALKRTRPVLVVVASEFEKAFARKELRRKGIPVPGAKR